MLDIVAQLPIGLVTWLQVAHLLALALALGGAVAADAVFLTRATFRPVDRATLLIADYLSGLVAAGLAALWVTGIALAVVLAGTSPTFMANEKFWAKVFIVVMLTVNAGIIHDVVLPRARAQLGRPLFEGLSLGDRLIFALAGALSVSSWLFPTVLGAARELNNRTPAHEILICYYTAVAVAFAAILALSYAANAWRARGAAQAPVPAGS